MEYNDHRKPRLFTVVTSQDVQYNMDFVEHLVKQEVDRRKATGQPALSEWEAAEFKRQLVRKLIVQGDAQAAINLRPTTTKIQLNG